jgi:hypothetical protein
LEGEKIKALRIYMPMDVLMEQLGATASPEQSVEPSHEGWLLGSRSSQGAEAS